MLDFNAFRVYLEIVRSMPPNEPWDRPLMLALTNKSIKENIQHATNLSWPTIRKTLQSLANSRIIDIQYGNGRGNRTKIYFLAQPPDVIKQSLPVYRPQLSKSQVAAAERVLKSDGRDHSEVYGPSWLSPSEKQLESKIITAPDADRAYAYDPFIGRRDFVNELSTALSKHHFISIVGEPGVGKTHLISWYQDHLVKEQKYGIQVFWTKLTPDDTLDKLYEDFTYHTKGDFIPNISSENSVVANKHALASDVAYALLADLQKGKYFLIIDNFEKILGTSLIPHDVGYKSLVKLLIEHDCGESRVVVISHSVPQDERGRSPFYLELKGMDSDDGIEFLKSLEFQARRSSALKILDRLDGNPLAMQLLSRQWRQNSRSFDPETVDYSSAARAVEDVFRELTKEEVVVLSAVAVLDQYASEKAVKELVGTMDTKTFDETVNRLVNFRKLLSASLDRKRNLRVFGMHQLSQTYAIETIGVTRLKELNLKTMNYWLGQADPFRLTDREWDLALEYSVRAQAYDMSVEILFEQKVAPALIKAGKYSQLSRILKSLLEESAPVLDETRITIIRRAKERKIDHRLHDVYRLLGLVNWRLGDLKEAIRYYKRLIALRDFQSHFASKPIITLNDEAALAGVYLDHSEFPNGIDLAETVLQKAIDNEDKAIEMVAWNLIGYGYDEIGPLNKAEDAYRNAIRISEDLHANVELCIAEARMGMVYWKVKRVREAGPHFRRALDLASELKDPYYLGLAQGDMGHYYMDKPNRTDDDLDKAIECYTKAKEIHESVGVVRGVGFWVGQLGRAYFYKGRSKPAINNLKQAYAIHKEVGDLSAIFRHFHYLGLVNAGRRSQRAIVVSLGYFMAAIELATRLDSNLERDQIQKDLDDFLTKHNIHGSNQLLKIGRTYADDILKTLETDDGTLP